jgi:F0F1-type ATP synthase delta subunit
MSDRSDAIRFAKELFDVTWRHNQADQVADELDAFAQAMRLHKGEAKPLYHPLVPQQKKLETMRRAIAELGLSRPTAVILEALVDAYRIKLLPVVADSFRARLSSKRGVIRARVTTAAALASDKASALQSTLKQISGRDVVLAAENAGHEVSALARTDLDVTDADAVAVRIERDRPGAVINCAAWTDVDGAEESEATAVDGNVSCLRM